ncbi:MAG: LysR family transcriptional regulator [Pseudomonadota bacterium]
MPLPSLIDIEAFITVAETGSFTQAAARLGVSANAISLRVQRLERALRVKLFVRTTRHVALTDEGERYLARITPLLEEMRSAQEDMTTRGDAMRGTVRIAIPGGVATEPFLDRLASILEDHRQLSIQIAVKNFAPNVAMDGLDIAVVVGQLRDTSFVGRRLGQVTWALAAAPGYLARHGTPRTPADLAAHRCMRLLTHPPQTEWALFDKRGRETIVRIGGNFEADDSRLLGDATYHGLGIGLRPSGELKRAVKAGTLKPVLTGYKFQMLDVYALLPKGRAKLPRIAICLDALRTAIKEIA